MKKKKVIIISIIIVIVILIGILIPVIINYNIKKEKEEILNNVNALADAIENVCKDEQASEIGIIPKYKYVIKDGKLDTDIKFDSILPNEGIIELDEECKSTLSILYGEYNIVKKNKEEAKIVEDNKYENGMAVYFDPTLKKVCNDYSEENSNDDVKDGCMKWYIFNDEDKNTAVTMILDHNTSSNIRWVSEDDFTSEEYEYGNKEGAITALKKLEEDTKDWQVKARFITVEEIKQIINLEEIDLGSTNSYFFDSKQAKPLKSCYKGDITDCSYAWLYDHTSINCKEYGCLNNATNNIYGYWTNTANTNEENKAWRVYFDGRITSTKIDDISSGIRPVIKIQKSILN